MLRLPALLLVALAMLSIAGPVSPAAAASCSIGNATLAFGGADTLSSSVTDASTSFHVTCSDVSGGEDSVTMCVALDSGTGGASGSVRLLSDAASHVLSYRLTTDFSGNTLWGDGSGSLGDMQRLILAATSGTVDATIDVYGEITAHQTTAPTGSYGSSLSASAYYAEGTALDCDAPGGAATATASLAASAEVQPNCLVDPGTLDFGNTGALSSNLDATTDIGITCTPGIAYDVALGDGLHAVGGQRYMQAGSGRTIAYDLYQNSERTTPWGSDTAALRDNRASATETVYGRVPPQAVSVGDFSDTVVITVIYAGDD